MKQKLIILGLVIGLVGFGKGAALADTQSWSFTTAGNYTISDEEEVEVADGAAKFTQTYNNIGTPAGQGFGVGACPSGSLPSGFSALSGSADPASDNYGNYQFQDNSIMVYIPKFYYRIGHADNPTYGTYGVNSIDVKSIYDYTTRVAAEAAGYALHRAFIDGGAEKDGFFFDKYKASKNAWGEGYIASSIQNGNPISTASTHNPIADLTACAGDYYYETINAAHARDGVDGAVNASSIFHVASRFQYSALAILSMAHGQASSATTYCAWYDATYNFPKGLNNNQAPSGGTISNADCNDSSISYTSDGFSNCGKTGSGTPFAKTTHNGQNSGVADLNGLMWEVTLGVTRDTSNFYVAKEATSMKDFTSGNSTATDHWGATGIAAMMETLTIPYITGNDGWIRFGNSTNQVLAEDISGNSWKLTGLGIPETSSGLSAGGTNAFGVDGLYRYLRNELCLISCAYWSDGSNAGVWIVAWDTSRPNSNYHVGFRAACYPE